MPVSRSEARAYRRLTDELMAASLRLITGGGGPTDEARAAVDEAVRRMTQIIASWPERRWTRAHLSALQRELALVADELGFELQDIAVAQAVESARAGSQAAVLPLAESGVLSAELVGQFPLVDPALLEITGGFTAMLIRQQTDELRAQIGQDVSEAVRGGLSQFDLLKRIENERLRTEGAKTLTFATLQDRAETQMRTEMARQFGMAWWVRALQLQEMFPGLKKRWRSRRDSRVRDAHKSMDEATTGDRSAIPVKDRFAFRGIRIGKRRGSAFFRFCRDPGARGPQWLVASLSINCGCYNILDFPATRATPTEVPTGALRRGIDTLVNDVERLERLVA